jgi:SAM-dependent methyltransferase
LNTDFVSFNQRADRSQYIARRFAAYLRDSVLDVGCDKAVLRGLLAQDIAYTGIDIGGTPDMVVNLEQVERLPFADNAFSCTVCSDVLEHLDNIHAVFGELVRVSRDHMVISLPNNWANARRPIERGKGSIAHYGLPAVRPRDRHKWFFGFTEAVEFLRAQEQLFPVSLVEMATNEKPRLAPVRAWRHLRYPVRERYLNRYAHTVWAVYRKRDG